MLFNSLKFVDEGEISSRTISSGVNFPAAQKIGELFFITTAANKGLYVWNGLDWKRVDNTDGNFLSQNGGVMQGPLFLSGPPTQGLEAATKQYVDTTVQAAIAGIDQSPPVAPPPAQLATPNNVPLQIASRDAQGNFSAGTISATLHGHADSATTAVSATTAAVATNLAGGSAASVPVKNNQGALDWIGGQFDHPTNSAAGGVFEFKHDGTQLTAHATTEPTLVGTNFSNIPNAALENSTIIINGQGVALGESITIGSDGPPIVGTSLPTPQTLVERDANGSFAANEITAHLIGDVTGNVSGQAGSTTLLLSQSGQQPLGGIPFLDSDGLGGYTHGWLQGTRDALDNNAGIIEWVSAGPDYPLGRPQVTFTPRLDGDNFSNIPTSALVGSIPNSSLEHASITINGTTVSLGNSGTINTVNQGSLSFGAGLAAQDGSSYNGAAAVFIENTGVLSVSMGNTGLAANVSTGDITVDGIVNIQHGGTGADNKAAAFDALAPGAATGDIIYYSSAQTHAALSVAPGVLSGDSGLPEWTSSPVLSGEHFSNIPNSALEYSAITINGQPVVLGSSIDISTPAASALTIGTGLAGTSYDGSSAVEITNTGVLSFSAGSTGLSTQTATGDVVLDGILDVAHGGTGSADGSITASDSLVFSAGGSAGSISLLPSGSGSVNVNNTNITNVAAPLADTDAATKQYVDTAISAVIAGTPAAPPPGPTPATSAPATSMLFAGANGTITGSLDLSYSDGELKIGASDEIVPITGSKVAIKTGAGQLNIGSLASSAVQLSSSGALGYNVGAGAGHLFFIDSSEIARFDPQGRFGIGSINPYAPLDVRGSDSLIIRAGDEHDDISLGISAIGGGIIDGTKSIAFSVAGDEKVKIAANGNFTIGASSGYGRFDVLNKVIIDIDDSDGILQSMGGNLLINKLGNSTIINPLTGNVGIGHADPQYKLHVSGEVFVESANGIGVAVPSSASILSSYTTIDQLPQLVLAHADRDISLGNARMGGDLVLLTSNAEIGRFTSTGYFGLGTATPSARLDVNGSVNISGALTVGGETLLASTIAAINSGGNSGGGSSGGSATEINVKHPMFGAVGDGTADDTAAFVAAFQYATAQQNPIVRIPAGTYLISSSAALLRVVSNMEVVGDGASSTVIKWSATYVSGAGEHSLFAGAADLSAVDSVTLRDFAIRGDHDISGYDQVGCYPILIRGCSNLTIKNIKVSYSRSMGIVVRDGMGVDISGCVVQYCARDGINTADCSYVNISSNRIEFCDDDAIAGHTRSSGLGDRGYVISGNIIRFSQGIKMLGAKSVSITGNTIEFAMGQGINVTCSSSANSQVEGVNASSGVVITGNIIKNCIDRLVVDGLNSNAPYISVNGPAAQAGGLAAVPGEADSSTGTIVPLYEHFENSKDGDTTLPIPNNYSLVIGNNVCMRDVPVGVAVSTFGFGQFYTRSGPVDPVLTEASVRQPGIVFLGGTFKNVSLNNNSFMGISAGLYLYPLARLIDATFNNNTVFDCTYGVVCAGTNVEKQLLYVLDNSFDLDPLHTSTTRGSNGTYTVSGSPTAILLQNASGVSIGGNRFKNCNRVSDVSLTDVNTVQGTKLKVARENYLECQPVATGFSTSNKGIANIPAHPGMVVTVVGSDPSSATFGQILNYCPTVSSSMPTSGTFVAGHRVAATTITPVGATGSKYAVIGWVRATTGSAHVLNTDWLELTTVLAATVTTMQGNITTAQSNITSLQSSVATAQSNITSLQSSLTTTQGTSTSLQSAVTALQTKVARIVSVRDPAFGAVGNGIADDTAAFNAALTYLNAQGGGVLYIPPGRYRKADTSSSIVMYSNITIRGDGDASVIFFDDTTTVIRSGNDMMNVSNTDNIAFENFKIEGTALTLRSATNAKQCITGNSINGMRMQGMTFAGLRFAATAFSYVNNAIFTGNKFSYIVRDGIRCNDSNNIVVSNNIFVSVSDDSVALHTSNIAPTLGSGYVVSDNIFEACQGIKILGAKTASIKNNIIRRSLRSPIYIELSAANITEGGTPVFDIDITGNQISDTFGTLGSNYNIYVGTAVARSQGALSNQPGVNAAPYDYTYLNDVANQGGVVIGMMGVRISNNSISRTLPTTTSYSAWGFGTKFDRGVSGFINNPAVTSADFQVHGIMCRGPVNGLQICNNTIRGMGTGYTAVLLYVSGTSNIQDYANTTIDSNTIIDCPGVGISCTDVGSGTGAKQIYITNNTFDIDPFFRASIHNADNTWATVGTSLALQLISNVGVVVGGNIFKNCADPGIATASVTETSPNIIYSDFVGSGNNAGNKGVRNLPSALSNIIIPIVGDPTSATFGNVLNTIVSQSSSMPTSGKYLYGHFVKKPPALSGSVGSQHLVQGWTRTTTGSNHVLYTDWYEVTALTTSTATALSNRFNSELNVRDPRFGAVGDGITNDRTAIQSAINVANTAGGGVVFIPAGTYRLDTSLTLYSNITLRGAGSQTIIKSTVLDYAGTGLAGGHRQLDIRNSSNFTIRDITFDSGSMTSFSGAVRSILLYACREFTVQNCKFITPGAATASLACSKYRIIDNEISVQCSDGIAKHDGIIDQWQGSHDFTIRGNRICANSIGLWPILATGQNLDSTSAAIYNFTISENQIFDCRTCGIWAMGRGGRAYNFTIANNIIDGVVAGSGIQASECYDFSISSNIVKNTTATGIRAYSESSSYGTQSARNGSITGNTIDTVNSTGAATSGYSGCGIVVAGDSDYINITGNTVVGTTHMYAIGVYQNASNICVGAGKYKPGTSGTIHKSSTNNITNNYPGGNTFSPTLIPRSGVVSAANQVAARVIANDDIITVQGIIDITTSVVGDCQVGISLPFASNFTTGAEATGTAYTIDGTLFAGIQADTTNKDVKLRFMSTAVGVVRFTYQFTYTLV